MHMPIGNIFIEENRPGLENFKPLPSYGSSYRKTFSFIIFHIDESGDVCSLEGNKFKANFDGTFEFLEKFEKVPRKDRYPEDCADFFIEGGTCFMPNTPNYKDIFLRRWDLKRLVQVGIGEDKVNSGLYVFYPYHHYLRIRGPGNSHGRIYSFQEIFPKEPTIDTLDPTPLTLEDFTRIGLEVLQRGRDLGIRLDSGYSAASVAQLFMLDECKGAFPRYTDNMYIHHWRAFQCSKASRFEARIHGVFPTLYYYDLVDAFPRVLMSCPSIQDCLWIESTRYQREAFYGFIRCIIQTSEDLLFSPVMTRILTIWGPRLIGFTGGLEVWLTKDEYDQLVSEGFGRVLEIREASWGIPESSVRPFLNPIKNLLSYTQDPIVGKLCKAMKHTLVGKMSQTWTKEDFSWDWVNGGYKEDITTQGPAISGQVYASKVRGAVRSRITKLALKYNAVAILADGFYTTIPILEQDLPPDLRLKSFGIGGVWTDMYHDHPGETYKLDRIRMADPRKNTFSLPIETIATIAGVHHDYGLSKASKRIGTRERSLLTIELGTKKRQLEPGLASSDYLEGNPESEAPPIKYYEELVPKQVYYES